VLPTDPAIAQHSGNSFQVPTVIHGKVYSGTQDRLVVFGLQRRRFPVCSLVYDDGGPVIFHCTLHPGPGALYLERKQGGVWKSVTDSNSRRDLPDFVSLWDYPTGDTATYRVCSKENSGCTPERSFKIPHMRPGTPGDLACGRIGKPPCSLYKSWPVSPGEIVRKTRRGQR
jgi:hypothetical protein